MNAQIDSIRRKLGNRLLILGHHYQRNEVIVHTDLQGDSFQLSAAAAESEHCENIVFCGVRFMAETADILANSKENLFKHGGRRVNVVLPDLEAGCGMADMATRFQVERCWNELGSIIPLDEVVPVTYVNSTADLKAFCGQHGGIACTSTNAKAVLAKSGIDGKAESPDRKVLFFPDQHLGRNTALKMGIPDSKIVMWDDAAAEYGGNTADAIRCSKMILWNGFCCVHQKFTPEHIDAIRQHYPAVRVIVHLECQRAVVEKADYAGSTSFILKTVTEAPAGTSWAIGTEGRFVDRLAEQNPDKTVMNLAFQPSICDSMARINEANLLDMLEAVEAGEPKNVIRVDENIAEDALVCLRRMLGCV